MANLYDELHNDKYSRINQQYFYHDAWENEYSRDELILLVKRERDRGRLRNEQAARWHRMLQDQVGKISTLKLENNALRRKLHAKSEDQHGRDNTH